MPWHYGSVVQLGQCQLHLRFGWAIRVSDIIFGAHWNGVMVVLSFSMVA
jgi:hypothetical protein